MTIAADGSDLRKVTRYAGGEVHGVVGSYSPDGQWILFREQRPDRSPLKVVRPDGSGAHALMEFPGITPRGSDWGAKAR